jgi:hypothetical protein
MFQAILMGLIATLNFVSAGDWFVKHEIAAGIAYLGFGIGLHRPGCSVRLSRNRGNVSGTILLHPTK